MPSTTQTALLASYGIESHWLRNNNHERRILIVYAHPDDESFGNAGTILHYTDADVAVHYACATRGEAGSVTPELLETYPDVRTLRTAELMQAATILGLASVHFLGYRDSGMQGAAENNHPDALYQAPLAQVAERITALIRLIRPQVLLTFNAYGGYGHPDHIVCHKATLAAFEAAANPTLFPEQLTQGLAAWQTQRLYFTTFPPRMTRLMLMAMRLTGRDPRRFGTNQDVDLVRVVENVTPITTVISRADLLERKQQAWAAHHSQGGGPNRLAFMPRWIRQQMSAAEYFTRVYPPWQPGAIREYDLFG